MKIKRSSAFAAFVQELCNESSVVDIWTRANHRSYLNNRAAFEIMPNRAALGHTSNYLWSTKNQFGVNDREY